MTSEMPPYLQKWTAIRARGKWRFIFLRGALGWGGSMFVVIILVYDYLLWGMAPTPWFAFKSALVYTIAGALFHALLWSIAERSYRKSLGP